MRQSHCCACMCMCSYMGTKLSKESRFRLNLMHGTLISARANSLTFSHSRYLQCCQYQRRYCELKIQVQPVLYPVIIVSQYTELLEVQTLCKFGRSFHSTAQSMGVTKQGGDHFTIKLVTMTSFIWSDQNFPVIQISRMKILHQSQVPLVYLLPQLYIATQLP